MGNVAHGLYWNPPTLPNDTTPGLGRALTILGATKTEKERISVSLALKNL